MPDPTDLLEPLRENDPTLVAPPVSDVRRRGDVLRRRRRGVRVAGAAGLVCVVAVGATYLTGPGGSAGPDVPPATTSPTPTPSPTPDLLTRGWPDTDGEGLTTGSAARPLPAVRFCGKAAYPTVSRGGRMTARLELPDEVYGRELARYDRTALAEEVVRVFLAPALGCQVEARQLTTDIRKIPLGDESFAVIESAKDTGPVGVTTYVIVRVGRTVVVSTRAYTRTAAGAVADAMADARDLRALIASLSR